MKRPNLAFLVLTVKSVAVWLATADDIFKGQEFLFNVTDRLASSCTFTVFIVNSNPERGNTFVRFEEILTSGHAVSRGEITQNMVTWRIDKADQNPVVKITSSRLNATVTLQASCGTNYQGKLSTTQLIPAANWGKSYTIVFPGTTDALCATVSLLSETLTYVTLTLKGELHVISGAKVVLDNGTALTQDGLYTLELGEKKRFQIMTNLWDMTGSKLESQDSFSVVYGPRNTGFTGFSGFSCVFSVFMLEQLVSDRYWGSNYWIPKPEHLSTLVRLVSLEDNTTVAYDIARSAEVTLAKAGDQFQYSLHSHDILESDKDIAVVATFTFQWTDNDDDDDDGGGTIFEEHCFSQVAPVSHTPLDASLVLPANLIHNLLVTVNETCTVQTSLPYTHDTTMIVNNTYKLRSLTARESFSNVVERLRLSGQTEGCSSDIGGVILSVTRGSYKVLSARPLAWPSCPQHTDNSVPCRNGELPATAVELKTSPTSTEIHIYTTNKDVTTTNPVQTSTEEKQTESTAETDATATIRTINNSHPETATTTSTATITTAGTITTATTTKTTTGTVATTPATGTVATATAISTTDVSTQTNLPPTTASYGGINTTFETAGQTVTTAHSLAYSGNKTLQCPCSCGFSALNFEEKLLQSKRKMKQLIERLLVQKDTLLKSRLKVKSVSDWRPLSVTLGASGVAFLVSTFVVMTCTDVFFLPRWKPKM